MADETMRLNSLQPSEGSKREARRVGRGIGSGVGKTAGRGHKGQKSRTGGTIKPGFEGGQMPLRKRLPKFGFSSRMGRVTAQIRLSELNKIDADTIDLAALKQANVINQRMQRAKVFLSGEITRPVKIKGLRITKGARAALEQAGGTVEE